MKTCIMSRKKVCKAHTQSICTSSPHFIISFTGMRTFSNSQSGKSVVCSPNGAKEIFKPLIKGLKSQNINRNQSVYIYFILNTEFNYIQTKFKQNSTDNK